MLSTWAIEIGYLWDMGRRGKKYHVSPERDMNEELVDISTVACS